MFAHDVEAAVSLDVSTLFVVATLVTALLGLFLLYAWTQERIRALAWWGAAYLIGGFSVALWSIGASFVPAPLPSAMLFFACGMIWNAARLFHGRPVLWPAMAIGSVAWLTAYSFPIFIQGGTLRAVLASVIISTYVFLTATELWRERRKSLIRRWPALFVPILHGAVFLFPLPLASLLPAERGVAALAGGWIAVFVLETILYAVGTAFIVLVLTKERTLRVHKTAALTDPMTGLLNRRGFVEGAGQVMTAHARRDQTVSALLFDLDHFKTINDRFGHAVGDDTLKLFASVVSSNLRANDLVARLGGEEFAAIIPGTVEEGVTVAERLRVAFESAARAVSGHYLGATVSVGVAGGRRADSLDVLLGRADEALYAAKAAGRNRVEASGLGAAPAVTPFPLPPEDLAVKAEAGSIYWTAYRRPLVSQKEQAAA
jgi:diguanylate cyclase (GGDEF)-like protein